MGEEKYLIIGALVATALIVIGYLIYKAVTQEKNMINSKENKESREAGNLSKASDGSVTDGASNTEIAAATATTVIDRDIAADKNNDATYAVIDGDNNADANTSSLAPADLTEEMETVGESDITLNIERASMTNTIVEAILKMNEYAKKNGIKVLIKAKEDVMYKHDIYWTMTAISNVINYLISKSLGLKHIDRITVALVNLEDSVCIKIWYKTSLIEIENAKPDTVEEKDLLDKAAFYIEKQGGKFERIASDADTENGKIGFIMKFSVNKVGN